MSRTVIRTDRAVTLLGAGDVAERDLDAALALGPDLVAADGGAAVALARGLELRAVIGDMDSLGPACRARLPASVLHHVAEQDSTDFRKCLDRIAAPLILGVGFLGARLDHSLAACHALATHAAPCLLIGADDVVFHAASAVHLDVPPGTRVSLFPMREVTGRSEGLRWPIDGLTLAPGGRIGTSNEATGPVRISPGGPGLLVLLPRGALDAALAAMASAG